MSKTSDPFISLRNLLLEFQNNSQSIIEINKKMNESMKPLIQLSIKIQKQIEPIQKLRNLIAEHVKQLKLDFSKAISNIEPPEIYDSSKYELHDRIHNIVLNMVLFADDMKNHEFYYLQERVLLGIDAHLNANYHTSLFCIFSAIDGMLTWHYFQNHSSNHYPNGDEKLKSFFEIYRFEHLIGGKKIKPKFKIFLMHRNEIMHGGKNSHFDKNLSTLALLFLGLVYASLNTKKKLNKL